MRGVPTASCESFTPLRVAGCSPFRWLRHFCARPLPGLCSLHSAPCPFSCSSVISRLPPILLRRPFSAPRLRGSLPSSCRRLSGFSSPVSWPAPPRCLHRPPVFAASRGFMVLLWHPDVCSFFASLVQFAAFPPPGSLRPFFCSVAGQWPPLLLVPSGSVSSPLRPCACPVPPPSPPFFRHAASPSSSGLWLLLPSSCERPAGRGLPLADARSFRFSVPSAPRSSCRGRMPPSISCPFCVSPFCPWPYATFHFVSVLRLSLLSLAVCHLPFRVRPASLPSVPGLWPVADVVVPGSLWPCALTWCACRFLAA